jgi:hypothetical protein
MRSISDVRIASNNQVCQPTEEPFILIAIRFTFAVLRIQPTRPANLRLATLRVSTPKALTPPRLRSNLESAYCAVSQNITPYGYADMSSALIAHNS